MNNLENLKERVIGMYKSTEWEVAKDEWEVERCEEDKKAQTDCVCGKENIKYLFTIRNKENGNRLHPIGSTCIKKFGRNDLDEVAKKYVDRFKLLHAVEDGEFIELSPKYFSRKILLSLYKDGAFRDTKYNGYNGINDYEFLLKMFNMRNKENMTEGQRRKVSAIILNEIKPFLKQELENKM